MTENRMQETIKSVSQLNKKLLAAVLEATHRAQLAYLTSGYYSMPGGTVLRQYWGLCNTFEKAANRDVWVCQVFTDVLLAVVDTPYLSTWDPHVGYMPIQDYRGNWHKGPECRDTAHRLGRPPSPFISLAIQTRTTVLNRMIHVLEEAIKASTGQ